MRTFEIYFVFIIFAIGTLLASCNGYDLNKFYTDMIQLHNKYRRLHDAHDLIYDDEISTNAKTIEDLDTLSENDDLLLTENTCYLVYKFDDITKETAYDVFMLWYNQGQDYNFTIEPENWNADHFTQIVWKSTEKVGFLMLEKFGKICFIAAYSPPGNQEKQYRNNVGELIEEGD